MTKYQAGLLMHRFSAFGRVQAIRRKNFQYLRKLIGEVACLELLALYAGVRAHGMYMFAMRYGQEHCGVFPGEHFLDLVQAEGAPIYRVSSATISDQLVIQDLMRKRPKYFRR